MRRIHAAPPPSSHSAGRSAHATFAELSSDPAIRRALWTEQAGRCAHCERILRDPAHPDHRTRIEHFHPQSASAWTSDCSRCSGATGNQDAPTRWTNLLLCCDGNEGAGSDFTCDKSKSDKDICGDFRNPKTWSHDRLLVVDRDGRIRPGSGLPPRAGKVADEVLKLNAKRLVIIRRKIIGARTREINKIRAKNHGLTDNMRDKRISRLHTEASTAEYASALLTVADHLLRKDTT
ncbi:hypothetical protein NRB56_73410 [Nocardia sp. RB56]|uniref:TIGR02646 family protein n=1 Tax=Nocardia aurantia TaxID=2585199 RepID=A0A7K0E1H0_9NOCA|nr:hypothetical protein [Nocardia aurantia]